MQHEQLNTIVRLEFVELKYFIYAMNLFVFGCLFLFSFGILKFSSQERPDLISLANGKYILDNNTNVSIILTKEGFLNTKNNKTPFVIKKIKEDIYVSPKIRVSYDLISKKIILSQENPFYLEFDDQKMQGFSVGVKNSFDNVHFTKIS